jgi:hypothetical protein
MASRRLQTDRVGGCLARRLEKERSRQVQIEYEFQKARYETGVQELLVGPQRASNLFSCRRFSWQGRKPVNGYLGDRWHCWTVCRIVDFVPRM